MATLSRTDIKNLKFDDRNINKGSDFGQSLLEKSITDTGMGRSLLADKNNVLIAGNKTLEAAVALGMKKVVIVETTGEEIIVVKRNDLDITEAAGIQMKIMDNTVSAHNYVENVSLAEALCQEADIMNMEAVGLKNAEADDEGQRISFNASKRALIKIELPDKSVLEAAEKDIQNLMKKKYPGAVVTVKGK